MFKSVWIQGLVALMILLGSGIVFSQAQLPITPTATVKTVFIGLPKTGTAFSGTEDAKLLKLSHERAKKLDCVIIKKGDKYFWTSRDDHEVEKIVGGAFITFRRLDRPDYVRIVNPDLKRGAALLDEAAEKFDYVEHITINLTSLTYYGSAIKYQPD